MGKVPAAAREGLVAGGRPEVPLAGRLGARPPAPGPRLAALPEPGAPSGRRCNPSLLFRRSAALFLAEWELLDNRLPARAVALARAPRVAYNRAWVARAECNPALAAPGEWGRALAARVEPSRPNRASGALQV